MTLLKSYGRRHGRPLSERRKKLLETLLPQVRIDLEAFSGASLDVKTLFAKQRHLDISQCFLEIGFGGGEHLAALAKKHPDVGFIGCEVFENGIASLLSHMEDHSLKNILIFPDDARTLLSRLSSQSLDRIYLLYPDPWPKKRHGMRRFLSLETLCLFESLLVDGGELHLASDHEAMIEHTKHIMQTASGFEPKSLPQSHNTRHTRYEVKGIREGRVGHSWIFVRNFNKIIDT